MQKALAVPKPILLMPCSSRLWLPVLASHSLGTIYPYSAVAEQQVSKPQSPEPWIISSQALAWPPHLVSPGVRTPVSQTQLLSTCAHKVCVHGTKLLDLSLEIWFPQLQKSDRGPSPRAPQNCLLQRRCLYTISGVTDTTDPIINLVLSHGS